MNDDTVNAPGGETPDQQGAAPFSMGEIPDSATETRVEPKVEPLSFTDKVIGVYSDPSPTFENLKQAGPRATDWVIPMTLLIVVVVIATVVKFSNPDMLAEMQKQQEEQMQKMVDEGKMTQEQADQALENMGGMGSGVMMAFSVVGVVIGTPIMFLLIALFYWLVLRFVFKGSATYYLVFAALSLVVYISILDTLISLLLGFVTGNAMATFSPALFMEPDLGSTTFKLLSAINPIQIWANVVLAIGFAKIAEVSNVKSYILVFGSWIAVILIGVFVGSMMGFGG